MQRSAVARSEGLGSSPCFPPWDDGADGVNDESGWKPLALGDLRVAGLQVAQGPWLSTEQLRAGGSMDGFIDAAAAELRRVGRVHDDVDGEFGDIAFGGL